MRAATSAVNRLRLHAVDRDVAALRGRVRAEVEAAEFSVAALPNSAILLIRRLSDPLPGCLGARRDRPIVQRWHEALGRRLRAIEAIAERGRVGQVPSGAEALLFLDEAELAACLALDLSRLGPVPWWRQAMSHQWPMDSVFELLQAQIRIVPSVMQHLAQAQVLDDVIVGLDSSAACSLCLALVKELGLSEIAALLEWTPFDFEVPPALTAAAGRTGYSAGKKNADAEHRDDGVRPIPLGPAAMPLDLPEPLHRWSRAVRSDQGRWQRLFVTIALAARNNLADLSAPATATKLRRTLGHSPEIRGGASPETARPELPSAPVTPAAKRQDRNAAHGPRPARIDPAVTALADPRAGAPAREIEPSSNRGLHEQVGGRDPGGDSVVPPWPEPSTTLSVRALVRDFSTELGGVFYLINLMEHLRLPECFEHGCGLRSAVGALGVLEGLARGLGGWIDDDDALWQELASLDGRAAGVPPRAEGLRQCLPHCWPDEWSHLIERFALGFANETPALDALRSRRWPAALIGWLENVLPVLRGRLAQALGPLPADKWLCLPARVQVTDVHIDVVASIEHVRLPLRIAGLDRSPGWVHSLQRVVLVHFE